MLQRRKTDFEGKRVVVSGSATSRFYTIEKIWLRRQGRRLLGFQRLRGRRGRIDLDLVKENQGAARARISEYARLKKTGTHYIEGGSIWDVPCDVAMPSATQNEINGKSAATLIKNGVKAVGEGANMPTTPEAVRAFREAGVLFAPGKAANAGGVATSALEMQQNASRDSWTFEQTEEKLAGIMINIHDLCAETAEEYGAPGDYVLAPTSRLRPRRRGDGGARRGLSAAARSTQVKRSHRAIRINQGAASHGAAPSSSSRTVRPDEGGRSPTPARGRARRPLDNAGIARARSTYSCNQSKYNRIGFSAIIGGRHASSRSSMLPGWNAGLGRFAGLVPNLDAAIACVDLVFRVFDIAHNATPKGARDHHDAGKE